MNGVALQVLLLALVVVLGALLVIRQRQLNRLKPPADLDQVLESLKRNLVSSRTEGKIQIVASQLSEILIQNLQSRQILFFRRQHRFMDLNYVYGLKNVHRTRYRIKLSPALEEKLINGSLLGRPQDLEGLISPDLMQLLEAERFNVVFPIFWRDSLFGVYFINTSLPADHPLVGAFLMFLNQNLSAAYHVTRLESARQILEGEVENHRKRVRELEESQSKSDAKEADDDPGHLIDMFKHRNVEELVNDLFEKVRAGLKAEKLVFVSRPDKKSQGILRYASGTAKDNFALDGDDFQKIFGTLQKREVYDIGRVRDLIGSDSIKRRLESERLQRLSTFSLSDTEQGLLFWTGRNADEQVDTRFLTRLESVARRAMVNAREFQRVEAMSYTDGLTALYNHRYFIKRLNEEIQRAKRYGRTVGLLLFDIDDFKLFNDKYGHQIGDQLLRRMGKTLSRSLRTIDIVARYGGDEFGIIMPEADKSTCGVFMDRLRKAISATDFRDQPNSFEGQITISIGSAIFPDDAATHERLIYCADMALLRSKAQGRNRSTVFETSLLGENPTA